MAITKILARHFRGDVGIQYVLNGDKTNEQVFTYRMNCVEGREYQQMKLTKEKYGKTVAAMDCLVPGIGEIIGGSQREDDYDLLRKRMEEVGLDEENYQFYLDLRKYGSTHHSGFGLGFERCVMYLTGISNIRDAIPFPRTVNNCEL